MTRLTAVCLTIFLMAGCSTFQKSATPDTAAAEQTTPQRPTRGGDNGDGPKAFKDVIKDDFDSDEGLFNVYRDDQTLYYEIPDDLLGRELLLVTRIAKTADNIGYGGEKANTQVVRWERVDDNVLLRTVAYQNVASEDEPIYQAVLNSNFEPIIMSFDIKAYNEDTTGVVIDVSNLFTSDVPSLGLQRGRRSNYQVRRVDGSRTYLVSAKSYPQNIEVRHVLTYEASQPPSQSSTGAISLEMNQSMIELPEDPMTPRLCDARVGFFSVQLTDYGRDAQKAEQRCYITRWRLEPSDPEAYARGELVDPVKPIVYYIDPATPEKWRPYLKQGVDDWQRAFEAAGFSNAIMGMDPPTEEEDPEFSPEDVRYSVIRYFASDVQNAYGPHVHDPRTGEILESDIGWFHNVMNLLRNWFFVQTAAVNPDARSVEFDDEVMGELIRFVSAHEVGHTLGFPHNWGVSYGYPVDSLRSPTFTATHGTAPSIMDYARFNYIAQPGDGVTNFYAKLGEYDDWNAKWGYSWTGMDDPDEERKFLNDWVVERADDPRYFYGAQGPRIDPRNQNEDLGDDAVYASDLGVENLKRILDNLVEWTEEEAKDYGDLNELYGNVAGQWNRYVGHVGAWVGGMLTTPKTYDQEGPVHEMAAEDKQRAAMDWLDRQVFTTPDWMLNQDVLRRVEGVGAVDRIRRFQVGAVNRLLDPQRLGRMIEAEVMMDDTYTVGEMFGDLRTSIWRELDGGEPISTFRRNLQRGHLARLEYLMENEAPPVPSFFASFGFAPISVSQSDIRAYVRGELEEINRDVGRALTRTRDRTTRLHLRDVEARIEAILDTDD
ncbi:MAG: zinc-dependent metalloprotease [Rhodothermales bacterium]|nr:zinc-dependent metalloprotease [Rhodothermales bacterium]MBO6780700.1 zinc-dependent metalloprotease [Rhodothermales bacterium]